jgi:leucyl-tRNA synthetase
VRTGHQPTVFRQKWPAWDEQYTTFDTVEIAVQVGGKTRGTIRVSADASEDVAVAAAMADPAISKFIDGRQIRKRIFVKGKILNLVVA